MNQSITVLRPLPRPSLSCLFSVFQSREVTVLCLGPLRTENSSQKLHVIRRNPNTVQLPRCLSNPGNERCQQFSVKPSPLNTVDLLLRVSTGVWLVESSSALHRGVALLGTCRPWRPQHSSCSWPGSGLLSSLPEGSLSLMRAQQHLLGTQEITVNSSVQLPPKTRAEQPHCLPVTSAIGVGPK